LVVKGILPDKNPEPPLKTEKTPNQKAMISFAGKMLFDNLLQKRAIQEFINTRTVRNKKVPYIIQALSPVPRYIRRTESLFDPICHLEWHQWLDGLSEDTFSVA
jgi:hypothetical protein